ncbi:nitroreductase [Pokkaliibacter plantistimulans]|uniref:Putative NAD(P)H nitroreductase n=1 Tax=Proteobacteria bacterium 228 TaxID=2083153 RepID=A0A2S5KL49_9PROT|nr:nitroreductase [Pokkaliibacter plantistimulans]PPC75528.1 nitroreductase [Pokkaliibacter plantistimulans]
MDALSLLQHRVSVAQLTGPAPTSDQLELLWQAALRAPDHGALRPWRFLVVQGEALARLGELFAQVAMDNDPDADPAFLEKCLNMPLRAPMLIVVIACCQQHPKVPEQEQILSAGAAAQNILLAAHAQGLGAIWRTGWVADDEVINQQLGLVRGEVNIGYIYIGTPKGHLPVSPVLNSLDFVTSWHG